MKNKFYDALNEIKADEQLKASTYAFLQEKAYKKKKRTFRRPVVVFASFLLLLFAGAGSYHLYFTEAAFLDLDVNPSIELTLNRFDRVIDVYAYNKDGKRILDSVDVRHKSYKDALKAFVDEMDSLGYIKDRGSFTATLNAKDPEDEKELLDLMKAEIDSVLQSELNTAVKQDVFCVDSKTKTHAHEQNLSPAKYLAIQELQKVDSSASFEGCRDHSIDEIKQQTHDHDSRHDSQESHNSHHSEKKRP